MGNQMNTSIQEHLGKHTLKDIVGVLQEDGSFILSTIILSNGTHLPIDVDKGNAFIDEYFIGKL
jgi:hypothetical protein